MAKGLTTKNLEDLANLLAQKGEEPTKEATTSAPRQPKQKSSPKKQKSKTEQPQKKKLVAKPINENSAAPRPDNGKGLFELAMQMRNSGKQFDFSNKELVLIYEYMIENGLTKAKDNATKRTATILEDILDRKGADLVKNPHNHLNSKVPEKYQWDFVNDELAISWLQDYLDDNHTEEKGKYTPEAQKLLEKINNHRRRANADNIEWDFRYNNSEESIYGAFILKELYQKVQNKDETLADDISSLSSKNLKALHDNLLEDAIKQENDAEKGIYRSIRVLMETELQRRRQEREQRKKGKKQQQNNTVENVAAPVIETPVEEKPVTQETQEQPIVVEQEAQVPTEEEKLEAQEQPTVVKQEEQEQPETEKVEAASIEPTTENINKGFILISPHYVNAAKNFFALSEDEQKEQISWMDAQDLLDWYGELKRNLGSGEYQPTAEEKSSFYNMAFPRVVELSRKVDENTADKEELETTAKLLSAYNVDFYGTEVNPLQSQEATRFVIQLQAKQNALATRFPENEEIIETYEPSKDDENSPIVQYLDDNELTPEEIEAQRIMLNLDYCASIDDGEDIYDIQDNDGNILAPWTDEEKGQKYQLDNFFKNVKIEYDDEWHKDILVRAAEKKVEISGVDRPYTKEEMKAHVYELAKEAAIQQILEQKNGNITLDDFDKSEFIREVRQAVLDQREQICISILETQISKDLVHLSKEEAHEKADAQFKRVRPFTEERLSQIGKIMQNLGFANNNTIILQDSSILSVIAGQSTVLKQKAQNLLTQFEENTVVGQLFKKSKQRINAFEAKLAKEHPYLNVVYSSAKMITAGAVIGAVGGPVATTAWIGYNVAKADKAFYNEYRKHVQTTGEEGFWKYVAKNPWKSTLTLASNVGIALGLVDSSAGGVTRMVSGAAGAFSAAAKDFAQGNWKMGITKMVTFATGYAGGSLLHGSDGATNAAENNDNTTSDATNDNTSNVSQEVYDKTVQDVNQYAQNMKLNIELPEEPAPQEDITLSNEEVSPKEVSHSGAAVHHSSIQNQETPVSEPELEIQNEEKPEVIEKEQIPPLSEIMEEEVTPVEAYVEQPPHAPALNEAGKITLLDSDKIATRDETSLTHVTIEQSDNGVVEKECNSNNEVTTQRSLVADADGHKHATIRQNGEARYMTPAEEEHFMHNVSVQKPVQQADADTAELLNKIHKMPAIQDVERAEFMAAQQESTTEMSGDSQNDEVSTKQIVYINQESGLENGQIREIDGKVVTMCNNGFSICSEKGSIAMVLDSDGKIHGYNFDANGTKTEMTHAQVNQQFNAALPNLRDTVYQNSDFAKAAARSFAMPQHQETRG